MENRKANKGFSFVELIIVVAILSIVMIMLTKFMASTMYSYNKTNANNKVQSNAQEIYDRIANHIMQAQAVKVKGELFYSYDEKQIKEDGSLVYDTPGVKTSGGVGVFAKDIDENFLVDTDTTATSKVLTKSGILKNISLTGPGTLYYDTTSGTEETVKDKEGNSVISFSAISSTLSSVDSMSGVDKLTTTSKYNYHIDATNLNILYADKTDFYIAKYQYDKTNKKLYLKIIKLDSEINIGLSDANIDGVVDINDMPEPSEKNSAQHAKYISAYKNIYSKFGVGENIIDDKYLLYSGVDNFQIEVDAYGNTIGVEVKYTQKNMKYDSLGMIKLRNSYVLDSRKKK